MYKDS